MRRSFNLEQTKAFFFFLQNNKRRFTVKTDFLFFWKAEPVDDLIQPEMGKAR